jgi:hypothetical protein
LLSKNNSYGNFSKNQKLLQWSDLAEGIRHRLGRAAIEGLQGELLAGCPTGKCWWQYWPSGAPGSPAGR